MNGVYLIIGGNMGDRIKLIEQCRVYLDQEIGCIKRMSKIYETAAWGKTDQPSYLNQVLYIETQLNELDTLDHSLSIERKMGRIRNEKWESRLIDIDILFFNDLILNSNQLKIPHPYLQNRRFVLVPLCEIAPGLVHPVFKQNISELLDVCTDQLEVTLFQD